MGSKIKMLNEKIYLCGIGAQKSGTTFVANYLSKHPDFCMSPLKELHYFNTQYKKNYKGSFEKKLLSDINMMIEKFNNGENINATLLVALIKRIEAANKNNYKAYFNYFIQKHHVAFGEITPAYSTLNKDIYKKIMNLFPNYKFLFLLRNPIDRFWSQVNYELKNSDERDPQLIIDEKLKDKAYLLRSDYKRTLEELFSVVKKEKVFVEFYENIFSSQGNDVMKKLSSFLEIDYREDLFDINKRINVTHYEIPLPLNLREKLVFEFMDIYTYISKNFDVPSHWRNEFEK